ncbi:MULTISPECIES: hypothetical protein [Tsukamurella]|uniref:DUF4282 domain-containing protein n=2 Tax=Tsukamurella TaxID=2060 RepID=A0A5C5RWX5_9ACTN|nr:MULTISPECIES: hypothetical protein [Tsukamurella]NMD55855.1 hypothetical protein [Tsukamurella columbiensis]TWS27546.1 hypothetical protein FK530_17570 [Tsukamurella conjunctivitidis]
MSDDDTWRWNESVAAPRRSVFYSRFIRFTTWTYVALVLTPIPVALVLGLQAFPRFVGPALLYILWMGALALFFGVLIAPAAGFVLAVLVTAYIRATVALASRRGDRSKEVM